MKNLLVLIISTCLANTFGSLNAQETAVVSNEISTNYHDRSPLYDYSQPLTNTDSIPDFQSKKDKLMLTGTIYQSDGVTPAKDVILYIFQPDENGDYEMKKENDKRYVYHRGWIKTNADGQYTFYTFVPGNFWKNREVKHIHPVIKEPGKEVQELTAFLFDNDPFLSNHCRKRLAKKGLDIILKLEKKDDMFVASKDIILEANASEVK